MPAAKATEADYDELIATVLGAAPSREGFWVFAYGSLIWNPTFAAEERRAAIATGWHRSFCLGWDHWFRGSVERPGLMLSLDRGGRCRGVACRLPAGTVEAELHRLMRREFPMRIGPRSAHLPRWIEVRGDDGGGFRALTFIINRNSDRCIRGLTHEQIADCLASAIGPRGSMAEYLHSTVSHLEELGLCDRNLWRLQAMVAERIEAADVAPHTAEHRAATASRAAE